MTTHAHIPGGHVGTYVAVSVADCAGVLIFFQAEDGIRHHCVTGVQTCGLFFSSRRRHTRSLCDWSSDVCSSDLGGAAANDLMMQFQADLLGVRVVRPRQLESTAQGAAYLAGLAVGYWQDDAEISSLWKIDRVFEPSMDESRRAEFLAGGGEGVGGGEGGV